MEDSTSGSDESDTRIPLLLARRQELTAALFESPYDPILFLQRAVVYSNLAYPDLAAGDAYRALLLTDEALNEAFEYHEQARAALEAYSASSPPGVLRHGALVEDMAARAAAATTAEPPEEDSSSSPEEYRTLAVLVSVRCLQILSLSLLLCGCLQSAYEFCERGLQILPENRDLLETKGYITTVARKRLRLDDGQAIEPNNLPDRGAVRREVYPWNTYEPDRFSQETLAYLNESLETVAPKCAVRVSTLPVLHQDGEGLSDGEDSAATCLQLGLFATENIAPGEVVLQEYSLLTANNRHKGSACDACGSELPPLEEGGSEAVSCPECQDTVFCDEFCYERAREQYHPAVCDKDVDAIAKDPDAADIDQSLYLLLLSRLLAMAAHQGVHPLDVKEVKYIWGDFVPPETNDIDPSPNAGPPPEWTLPFSFRYNIEIPLHVLEKMDVDVFATLREHDLWVFNTAYAKFRGTASARKNPSDGRPDVAAVHPFWCLANHDCDPNVTWEWGGRMVLRARETRVVGNRPGGIRAGEEILNHYCDVDLPVEQRREWARGSLGGWCMCDRCRREAAVAGVVDGNNSV
ncbi:hypothetical protein VTK73DRAFT_8904 [Phialemonium thermophilum]|uniref:SET domain-containing protein n=1 Tax=Phialemonium thermophilum TaxID=223376 RepID=A0ABR3W5I9_9PEZI